MWCSDMPAIAGQANVPSQCPSRRAPSLLERSPVCRQPPTTRSLHVHRYVERVSIEPSLKEAGQVQLRLDDGQFELCPLQPRVSPVGIATAVVVDSALRRRYAVSCALQVGNGVLPGLRPRAFLARSLRRPPGEDGRLELLPSRHRATPIIPAEPANQTYSARLREPNCDNLGGAWS